MRNGKIATLPHIIIEELNCRLDAGQDGPALLDWLNTHPDVQQSLQEDWEGQPLTKQNLSQWRLGGYREWQLRQDLEEHAQELAEHHHDLDDDLDLQSLPGQLAAALATRYAALLNTWQGQPDADLADELRLLHSLNRDIALLQKTLHQSAQQLRQREEQEKEEAQQRKQILQDKILNPVMAARMEESMADIFGGGPAAENLARLYTAVKYDLPIPKINQPSSKSKPSASKAETPTKPKPARPAPASTAIPSPVAPSHATPPPQSEALILSNKDSLLSPLSPVPYSGCETAEIKLGKSL
jgi:hypothetical protein